MLLASCVASRVRTLPPGAFWRYLSNASLSSKVLRRSRATNSWELAGGGIVAFLMRGKQALRSLIPPTTRPQTARRHPSAAKGGPLPVPIVGQKHLNRNLFCALLCEDV